MPPYLGKNLLRPDFSGGVEPIPVPCTNDVDSDPPPYLKEYITKSRFIPLLKAEMLLWLLYLQSKVEACDVGSNFECAKLISMVTLFIRLLFWQLLKSLHK